MIFLVVKILVYLAVALCLGAAGGWLLRNLAATRHEEALNRQLIEARGRVPQLESQLRSQEEMASQLKVQIEEKQRQMGDLSQALKERDEVLVEKERALSLLRARLDGGVDAMGRAGTSIRTEDHVLVLEEVEAALETEGGAETEPSRPEDSLELRALETEVNCPNIALEAARSAAAPAPAAVAGSPELLDRIADLEHELQRAKRALRNEQRRVTELERQRELQNRTLQALHQQLEMAKESRRATGS